MVIEIGRKIRVPEDEETGVETYSSLWGIKRAVIAWLSALFLTAICAVFAAALINFVIPVMVILVLLLVPAVVIALNFSRLPCKGRSGFFEPYSALWTLLIYISLGVAPLGLRHFL